MSVQQSTQADIKQLTLILPGGIKVGIKDIFDEINIFENVMFPCSSGNIVIRDAIGLASKINFDGSERVLIEITKDVDNDDANFSPVFNRTFVIYKKTNRAQLTQNSEIYTLHFVAEEFLLSQQKKIRKTYTGTYTDIVRQILQEHLKIENTLGDVANIYETKGIHTITIPNLSPIEAIEFITKRASSVEGVPDFLFWQTRLGYNFMPVSWIMSNPSQYEITFGAKNLSESIEAEMYGARDFKILSQFNSAENIASGVYAGTFIGFDTLTRTIQTTKLNFDDVYKLSTHANSKGMNTKIYNKENTPATEMYDSRITLYPFQLDRSNNAYVKENDSESANIIDDSHNYILQRKAIFTNLLQKRIRIVMPGNFRLMAGELVNAYFPNQFNETDKEKDGDKSLVGKYIILSVRHIVRYDKHETILEVATDSTNYGT